MDILMEKLDALTAAWKALPEHGPETPDISLQWSVDSGMLWLDRTWICPARYVDVGRLDEYAQKVQDVFIQIPLEKESVDIIIIREYGKYAIRAIERHF